MKVGYTYNLPYGEAILYSPNLATKDGAGSPQSVGQQQPSASMSHIENITFKSEQVAQRIGRAAKKIHHSLHHAQPFQWIAGRIEKAISKFAFYQRFFQSTQSNQGIKHA